MKTTRWALALLAMTLLGAAGCFMTSAQIGAQFPLPTPLAVNGALPVVPIPIDLNAVSDYSKNKDKLKNVIDVAILGTFVNNSGAPASGIELWMTPDASAYTTAVQVQTNGIKLWGPLNLAASETRTPTWDQSSALFNPAGRAALVQEARGDGQFTLYMLPTNGSADMAIRGSLIAFVLDVGI